MRVPGVPFDQCAYAGRPLAPIGGVLHRTYGGWAGDYSVGKFNPNKVGFHFLIGRTEGQWVQFNDTDRHCNHAPGANSTMVGIEFTGRNEDVLTPWQVEAGGRIIAALTDRYRWPLDYYDGPRRAPVRGWTTHASVLGSDHGDRITRADWQRLVAAAGRPVAPPPPAPGPTPTPAHQEDDEVRTYVIAPDGGVWVVAGVWRLAQTDPPPVVVARLDRHRAFGGAVFDCRPPEAHQLWADIVASTKVA